VLHLGDVILHELELGLHLSDMMVNMGSILHAGQHVGLSFMNE